MKKTLVSLRCLTTSVLLFFAAVGLWAYDFQQNGIHYTTLSFNTVRVVSGGGYSGNIVIPEKVLDGDTYYTVTEVGYRAFYDCEGLTSVSLPKTVERLGEESFRYSGNLHTINLENVKQIEACAFQYCSSLTAVTFSDELAELGGSAFYETGLTSITIPAKTKFTGDAIFGYSTQLQSAVFLNSPDCIGTGMFEKCTSLQNFEIPASVNRIADRAFYNSGLTSIKIPSGVTEIGNSAFSSTSLTSVEIGEGVKKFDDYAFCATSLNEIILPESLDSIGREAFGYTKIESVQMPANIKFLGKDALGGSIKSLYIQNLDKWIMAERGSAVLCNNPDSKIYLNNRPLTRLTIPDGVTQVNDYAFANATCIRTITFPESGITRIGIGAFVRCTSLTGAEIPEGVEVIATEAFGHCKMLSALSLPQSLREIHGEDWWQGRDGAFEGCDALTEIIIPDNVTFIGDMAFCYLGNVTSITLGKSVETLGQWAFGNCAITQIILPDALVYAKDDAFMGCSQLDSMFIGKSYKDGYGQDKARYIWCNALNAEKIGNFPNARVFTFGPDVQTIPSNFAGSSNMVELHSESTIPPYVSEGAFSSIDKETCILYVPKGCVEDYRMEYEWEDFKYIWEEGTNVEPFLTLTNLTFDGTTPFRIPDEYATALLAADVLTTVIDYTQPTSSDVSALATATNTGAASDYLAMVTMDTRYGVRYNDDGGWYTQNATITGRQRMAIVMKNNGLVYYMNGTYGRDVSDNPQPTFRNVSGADAMYLGGFVTSDNANKYPFTGTIHSARFYTWELTTAQIAALSYDNLIPTGVEEVKSADLVTDDVIYDLSGRRVTTPGKGIYISNGQKLILK